MAQLTKYNGYFKIDTHYFPNIHIDNADDAAQWSSYFPHVQFVQLVGQTIKVVQHSAQGRGGVMVVGPYGTGKSHTLLTLAALFERTDEEVKQYFERFPTTLTPKLLAELQGARSLGKTNGVVVVTRTGTSDVHNDAELCQAIQDSVVAKLDKLGLDWRQTPSAIEAFIEWQKEHPKAWCEYCEKQNHSDLADNVEAQLRSADVAKRGETIAKVLAVGRAEGINCLKLNAQRLVHWLTEVGNTYHRHILFIYDEFSEYLGQHPNGLAGLQTIADAGKSNPFTLLISCHRAGDSETRTTDGKKISDRFLVCKIEMPDTVAFELLSKAMAKTDDPRLLQDWKSLVVGWEQDTKAVRQSVAQWLPQLNADKAEKLLLGILPMHPYTALVLKRIAEWFASNQRSLFDYIRNPDPTAFGFLWYCQNFGPDTDEHELLTIDLLWGFLYDNPLARANLDDKVSYTLTLYEQYKDRVGGNELRQRLLKAVLLLQVLDEYAGNNNSEIVFKATVAQLQMAFAGTSVKAEDIATALKNMNLEGILSAERFPVLKGSKYDDVTHYKVGSSANIDSGDMDAKKQELLKMTSRQMLNNGDSVALTAFKEPFEAILPECLKMRCRVSVLPYEGGNNSQLNQFFNAADAESKDDGRHLHLGFLVSRHDEVEAQRQAALAKLKEFAEAKNVVLLSCSACALDEGQRAKWAQYAAEAALTERSDGQRSKKTAELAAKVLLEWRDGMLSPGAAFYRLSADDDDLTWTRDNLEESLLGVVKTLWPCAPETFLPLVGTMYAPTRYKDGALQALKPKDKDPSGAFQYFRTAPTPTWKLVYEAQQSYMTDYPINPVSQYRRALEEFIDYKLKDEAQVSLSAIFMELLRKPPFGILPTGAAAYLVGFVMRGFLNAEQPYLYKFKDTTVPLTADNLSAALECAFKDDGCPDGKLACGRAFIAKQTPEIVAMLKATQTIFHLPEPCSSVEVAVGKVRSTLNKWRYPLVLAEDYVVRELPDELRDNAKELLKLFRTLLNNSDMVSQSTTATAIGKLLAEAPKQLVEELAKHVNEVSFKEATTHFALSYCAESQVGERAPEKGDLAMLLDQLEDKSGNYLMRFTSKVSNDGSWLWVDRGPWEDALKQVIVEYQIVVLTNRLFGLNEYRTLADAIGKWRATAQNIRMPADDTEFLNRVGGCRDLVLMLRDVLADSSLLNKPEQCQRFRNVLTEHGNDFIDFYNRQEDVFQEVYQLKLEKLAQDERHEVFEKLPARVLRTAMSEYYKLLQALIENVVANSAAAQLNELWRERTHTASPEEWATLFRTPLEPFPQATDAERWRLTLNLFDNLKTRSAKDLRDGLEFLSQQTELFEALNSAQQRDDVFCHSVLQAEKDLLADRIEEVRDKLAAAGGRILRWHARPDIRQRIEGLAREVWVTEGYEKASNIIQGRGAEAVKDWLLKLLKDNYKIGVVVLKEKD